MTNLSYSITETIYRQHGRIIKLVYDYEENQEEFEINFSEQKQESNPKYRHYRATIKRDEYERLIDIYKSKDEQLSFEGFICILRPIMRGTYDNNELQDAFYLLDKHRSNTIDLNQLIDFLSIIQPDITKDILLNYIDKDDVHIDEKLNFNEFNDLILHGIGRYIVCGYI